MHNVELEIEGKKLSIQVGELAKQADGSALMRLGDTVVLVTAVAAKEIEEERDFFPLTVDYREKAYAAGKIPGGFFKREGRPSEKEILSARLIDRPLRPLFPEGYFNEVQVMAMVLSSDQENDADILGIIGASTALYMSGIPFSKPIGAVRVGRIDKKLVCNPTFSELDQSDINLIVAGTMEHINMVEGGCKEISEEDLLAALEFGHNQVKRIIQLQEELINKIGKKPKSEVQIKPKDQELVKVVTELAMEKIKQANRTPDKSTREQLLEGLIDQITIDLAEKFPESEKEINSIILDLERDDVRGMIINEKKRADGRTPKEIRPITCEIGILPRAHGSALFTRGQTQSLAATTLGTKIDEQRVDDLEGESTKSYMLHYNFPPFSVGEVKPVRGPGRREIGHGALAEKAIEPVIPKEENFPYTIRIVSDILESNGSSSMATVCAGTLSLMDAGVPIKAPVAGIAMGLVKEGAETVILSDILGIEDHLGDMDFKVTGTREGITAFQMDIKISGLDLNIIKEALTRAREGRVYILDLMEKTIAKPRPELSMYAPRIIILKVKQDKIGEIIGPGGKTIRAIIEQSGAKIDIEDDGTVFIASVDQKAGELAKELVLKLTEEVEIGKVYNGKVKRIAPFGAFVEILPGQDGLVHISEIDYQRVNRVEDVLKVGDELPVKVIGIDTEGKIKLSRKACIPSTKKSDYKSPPE
ncbi:MAG: polyribonucleotide nucleotidyltransferase [candidate division Zixibacteria bacterium]|nr:polyribonucleotide nucleotidyltransferase [candidate division Zixibacteria bacterium]